MKNLEKLAELANALPEPYKANATNLVALMGEVIEGIGDTPREWKMGHLKVVQGTSDRSKLPKGTAIGSMVLGDEIKVAPFEVIPMRSFEQRQMWDSNPENPRMLCNSPDAKTGYAFGNCRACSHGTFNVETNKSDCNKGVSVICITADLSNIFLAQFSKSQYAGGKDWLKLMSDAKVATYKRTYNLRTETSKKSKNVEVLLAANGAPVAKELLEFLSELFARVSADREQHLVSFYEYLKTRAANTASVALPHAQQFLDAPSGDGSAGVTEVDAEVVETVAPAKGKKAATDNVDYKL